MDAANETVHPAAVTQFGSTTASGNWSHFDGDDEHLTSHNNIYLTFLYGLLAIVAISLLPLLALLMRPIAHKSFYKSILLFLMAMSVGILTATSLLFLFPTAIGLDVTSQESMSWYIGKMGLYFGTFIFFLNFEILFKLFIGDMTRKTFLKNRPHTASQPHLDMNDKPLLSEMALTGDGGSSIISHSRSAKKQATGQHRPLLADRLEMASGDPSDKLSLTLTLPTHSVNANTASRTVSIMSIASQMDIAPASNNKNATVDVTRSSAAPYGEAASAIYGSNADSIGSHQGERSSLVWVILAGDSIHSFVDGVAIGSTIAKSLVEGLTMALVIFVEETPHKLGDVAVLLNTGLPNCRSIIYCWLASLPCYVGYVVGVLVGNVLVDAIPWIYTIAAALFLYTALSDILPQVMKRIHDRPASMLSSQPKNCCHLHSQFFVRLITADAGLIAGFVIAALLAAFEKKIQIQ